MNYNVNKSVLLSTLIDAYSESRADRFDIFEVWLGQTLKGSYIYIIIVYIVVS